MKTAFVLINKSKLGSAETPLVFSSFEKLSKISITEQGESLSKDALYNRLLRNNPKKYYENEGFIIKKCNFNETKTE